MTPTHELTPQTAHRVIAARLSGETRHVDEAAGLYINDVDVDDQGLEITVVDEHDEPVAFRLTASRIHSRALTTSGQPVYLDSYPFVEPAPRP